MGISYKQIEKKRWVMFSSVTLSKSKWVANYMLASKIIKCGSCTLDFPIELFLETGSKRCHYCLRYTNEKEISESFFMHLKEKFG